MCVEITQHFQPITSARQKDEKECRKGIITAETIKEGSRFDLILIPKGAQNYMKGNVKRNDITYGIDSHC